MKKLLLLALFGMLTLGAFTSCEEEKEPTKAIELTGGQTTQSVFADQEQASGGLSFTTNGPWTSTISESTRAASWISIDPSSGSKAGDYTIAITLEPNYTGADRTATITIVCGDQQIPITVTQKATTEDGVVPEPEVDVLTLIPDPVFLAYCRRQMDYQIPAWDTNRDGKLSPAEAAAVQSIEVGGEYSNETQSYKGEIASLEGIGYFTGLTSLGCGYNQLTELDVSANTALTDLDCIGNQLTTLDVSANSALTRLWCYENQLTALDVSKNTALTTLVCIYNQLTSLDVSKNTALTTLACTYNQLTSLDVSKNTALTWLLCGGNQLTSLDVSKNTALTNLDCSYNQLTELDISNNYELCSGTWDYFDFDHNPGDGVSTFPVKAWFDNNSIPEYFSHLIYINYSWYWNGNEITPYFYTE